MHDILKAMSIMTIKILTVIGSFTVGGYIGEYLSTKQQYKASLESQLAVCQQRLKDAAK